MGKVLAIIAGICAALAGVVYLLLPRKADEVPMQDLNFGPSGSEVITRPVPKTVAPVSAPYSAPRAVAVVPVKKVAAPILKTPMKISQAGIKFIAGFEGYSGTMRQDPAGNTEIGYGHLIHLGPMDGRASEFPFKDGITKVQGIDLLQKDAALAEKAVNKYVTVTLTQAQFDALVSFVYNIGVGNFLKSSVLKYVNQNNFAQAQESFLLWNKAGGVVLAGLTRRRESESEAFA